MNKGRRKVRAIDCQGFAGAFTLGMAQAGFEVVGKRENIGGFGVPLVEANRHLINDRLEIQVEEPAGWEAGDVDVVFGNPPCSGFSGLSTATAAIEKRFSGTAAYQSINDCMWDLVRFAVRCRSQVVVMESVQAAYTRGQSLMQELRAEMERLTGQKYDLAHVLHNAAGVGGATIRKRYFMVLTVPELEFGIDPPVIDRVTTVRDVLADLSDQPLSAGSMPYAVRDDELVPALSGAALRSSTGEVDGHELLWNSTTAGKGWLAANGWKPTGEKSGTAFARLEELGITEKDLKGSPLNHARESDDLVIPTIYTDTHSFVPTRLHPDKASPVLTGTGVQDKIHPWLHRTITFREMARIMGWPDDWSLAPIWNAGRPGNTQKWLGKGITVQVGRWIGGWVAAALEGTPGGFRGHLVGEREWLIDFTNDHKAVYDERTGEARDSRSVKLRKEMDVVRPALIA